MPYLTVRQFAEVFQLHEKSVYRMISNNTIPESDIKRIGKSIRINVPGGEL